MLVEKLLKKFESHHRALIESETRNFIENESVTKDSIRLLEYRIKDRVNEYQKADQKGFASPKKAS